MKGYTNANGDDRDVLDRYLPTPYRKSNAGTETHNALLGAIKGSILSTEQDLIDNVKQVYINNATGKLLDLYGKWIGLNRYDSESDDDYRKRLLALITTERVTISGIIKGIKQEVNDPDLVVSIYEPWRNIFIMNQSLLNGPDRIMGEFYRYAVIQVTLNKYVPQDQLTAILKKYKAAGVQVVYVLANGMTIGDELLEVPIRLDNSGRTSSNGEQILNSYTFGLNDLPTGELKDGIFKTNSSDLNGDDVLAGSPENTYAYQYGTVPSKNIFGIVDKTSDPTSFTDPYDYVYQGTKVDMSSVGGRNYIVNSDVSTTSSIENSFKSSKTISSFSGEKIVVSVQVDYDNITSVSNQKRIGAEFTVVNATTNATLYLGAWKNPIVGESFHGRIYQSFDFTALNIKGYSSDDLTFGQGIYVQGVIGTSVSVSRPKIEIGSTMTIWTPAPEDTPKTYIYPYKNTSFVNMGRKDEIVESLENTGTSLLTVALDVKDFMTSKGYGTNFDTFKGTAVTGIVLDLYGSPYGLSSTSMTVKSAVDGSSMPGNWYHYDNNTIGTLIGTSLPSTTMSSSSYFYKLTTPGNVGSILVTDYYPDSGATRSFKLFDGTNYIRFATTTSTVTGTITVPSISSLNSTLINAYIKELYLDMLGTATTYSIFDYNKSTWTTVTPQTNLVSYVKDGVITGASYILIRFNKVGAITQDYIGLNANIYS